MNAVWKRDAFPYGVSSQRFAEQAQCLSKTDADDLLIIFSYTGIFYDYGYP